MYLEHLHNMNVHPYRTAKILYNGEEIGYLGQLTYEIQKEEKRRENG